MKVVKVIWLFVLLPILIQAQGYSWGNKAYLYGQRFKRTDSLAIAKYDTYLIGQDTLYTDGLDKSYQWEDGVFTVRFAPKLVDDAQDSIYLDVRLGTNYGTRSTPDLVWDDWQHLIGPVATGSNNYLHVAQADCTWYGPSNVIQYRCYNRDDNSGVDADTVQIRTTDFRN